MIKNFKLTIEYDGTPFYGWQRQNDRTTVQGELENALSRILNQEVKINGSGRTDAGVHAYGQVASFPAKTRMRPVDLKKALNSFIKLPIVIRDCHIVALSFHAQYSAVSKEYQYIIYNAPDPAAINRQYQWHVRKPLEIVSMNKCCRAIIGIHDFKSFENTGSPRSSTIREVLTARVENRGTDHLVFKICATGFLKYMVRNLVGTLVHAGLGKITHEDFIRILKAKNRTVAGPTAPPHGLFLNRVNYS